MRWDRPQDRLQLQAWLNAPRRGYRVRELTGFGLVVVVSRQRVRRYPPTGEICWMGPRLEVGEAFSWVELAHARAGWRWLVAQGLRNARLRLRG